MPKNIAANTVLPKGGKLLSKPIKKSIGGWVEMEFDAKLERLGLTWLRVNGGMGQQGDREDWVADIPSGCLCVHDYQFRPPYWGLHQYPSFDAAIRAETMRTLERQREVLCELEAKAENATQAIAQLEAALKS